MEKYKKAMLAIKAINAAKERESYIRVLRRVRRVSAESGANFSGREEELVAHRIWVEWQDQVNNRLARLLRDGLGTLESNQ